MSEAFGEFVVPKLVYPRRVGEVFEGGRGDYKCDKE